MKMTAVGTQHAATIPSGVRSMAREGTFKLGDEIVYDSSEGRAKKGIIDVIRDTQTHPLKTAVPLSRFLFTVYTEGTYRYVYESMCREPINVVDD
jgi:hypothetical protein